MESVLQKCLYNLVSKKKFYKYGIDNLYTEQG